VQIGRVQRLRGAPRAGHQRADLGEGRARAVAPTVLQDGRCIESMQRFVRGQPALGNEDIGL
jgi:hypothetical protein